MTLALIIFAFAIICFIEIPDLVKKHYWRELVIFIAFLIPGFVLTMLVGLNIKIPSPIPVINFIVEQVLSIF